MSMPSLRRSFKALSLKKHRRHPASVYDSSLPKTINVSPQTRHTFRYVAGSTMQNYVTSNDLFACPINICTVANSNVRSSASSFKINSVTVYPAAGTTATVIWASAVVGCAPDREFDTALPTGVTTIQRLYSAPPKNSLAAEWYNTAGANVTMIIITCNTGSVVDLDLSWTTVNSAGGINTAIGTGTLGASYYMALDGASSHNLPPSFLPTTF